MLEEKELTPRDAALKAIQEGGSVRVGGFVYALRASEIDPKIKGFKDLPGEEAFVGNNPALKVETLSRMSEEMESLKAKYEALKNAPLTEDKKVQEKPETKVKGSEVKDSEEGK